MESRFDEKNTWFRFRFRFRGGEYGIQVDKSRRIQDSGLIRGGEYMVQV